MLPLLLSILACAPDLTPEKRANAAYDGCVTMFNAWCDCQPAVCADYTAEQECAGYAMLECEP